jgi:hypothetical protein
MPICLSVRLPNGKDSGRFVNLEDEIIEYFYKLDKYVWISSIFKIDPYDNTKLHARFIDGLLKELPEYLQDIKSRQTIVPPARVGTYGSCDPIYGYDFGWDDLEKLVLKMILTLEFGKNHGSVWADGD